MFLSFLLFFCRCWDGVGRDHGVGEGFGRGGGGDTSSPSISVVVVVVVVVCLSRCCFLILFVFL